MDFLKITRQYYSLFLGKPNILCDSKDAVAFVYSDDRNKTLPGYLDKFDIYALSQNNNIIVSYGNKALSKINALKESDIFDADSLICAIRKTYNRDVAHNVKFYYQQSYESKIAARALDISDYSAYLSFFKKNNPRCKNTT